MAYQLAIICCLDLEISTPMIEQTNDRLIAVIDHQTEAPDIEYKEWMDLFDNKNKAKIAKHLCALCNFGGGYLIFGIGDDGAHAEPHPGELSGYNQDLINGIVEKYLAPAFHCSVYAVRSKVTGKL